MFNFDEVEGYLNLGFTNSWKQLPEKVITCRNLKHTTADTKLNIQRTSAVVICNTCKTYYMYDSSD